MSLTGVRRPGELLPGSAFSRNDPSYDRDLLLMAPGIETRFGTWVPSLGRWSILAGGRLGWFTASRQEKERRAYMSATLVGDERSSRSCSEQMGSGHRAIAGVPGRAVPNRHLPYGSGAWSGTRATMARDFRKIATKEWFFGSAARISHDSEGSRTISGTCSTGKLTDLEMWQRDPAS